MRPASGPGDLGPARDFSIVRTSWISHGVLGAIAFSGRRGMTRAQIGLATGLDGERLDECLRKLCRREFVASPPEGDERYRLTTAGQLFFEAGKRFTSGPRGPQPGRRLYSGTLRERVWRAVRIRRKFSTAEIIRLVVEQTRSESNVQKYLRFLARAGYLQPMRGREPGTAPQSNGYLRYFLVRDTGPQAPRFCAKRRAIWDPNTGEEFAL